MVDIEKVIKGLGCHQIDKDHRINCSDCPYHCDEFMNGLNELHNDALALLKELQPKTGHWLKKMSNYPSAIATGGSRTSACDLCGGWGRKTFKYCPHCGAKMEGR